MSEIIPYLWFNDEAEDAVQFYVSVFKNAKIEHISRYGDSGPLPAGSAMVVEFQIHGQEMMALNGSMPSSAEGQPPVSLFVKCDTQAEVDDLWDQLSAGGRKLQCGWLVDRYGVTWNIVPDGVGELLGSEDIEKQQRAMKAMLEMEKLDINELRRAYEGVTP